MGRYSDYLFWKCQFTGELQGYGKRVNNKTGKVTEGLFYNGKLRQPEYI